MTNAPMPTPVFSEDDRRHLDMIQGIITRLAGNQFLFKGWALTVAAAINGYAAAHHQWAVAAVGAPVAVAFWALDAYFLWQERLFRKLWVKATARPAIVTAYSLDVSGYRSEVSKVRWRADENGRRRAGAALSAPIVLLHGLIVVAAVIIAAVIAFHGNSDRPGNDVPSRAHTSQN